MVLIDIWNVIIEFIIFSFLMSQENIAELLPHEDVNDLMEKFDTYDRTGSKYKNHYRLFRIRIKVPAKGP